MTELVWDQLQDRIYEAGIERGVLFPVGGDAEVWNGLVSVTENRGREVKSYYIDGVKFLDHYVPGAYSGRIQALTYPESLDALLGITEFAPGVHVHDQPAGMFHLTYRTRIGDAIDPDIGYKLHLVYNLTANPSDVTYNTRTNAAVPTPFEFAISGIQTSMWGIRPTSHLSFDSRNVDPAILSMIEEDIYGTADADPNMPDLVTLLTTIEEMTIDAG